MWFTPDAIPDVTEQIKVSESRDAGEALNARISVTWEYTEWMKDFVEGVPGFTEMLERNPVATKMFLDQKLLMNS